MTTKEKKTKKVLEKLGKLKKNSYICYVIKNKGSMKVKELIEQLSKIENQDAEITLLGNVGHPEDEDTDLYFDTLELWEDGEETITLFVGLSEETLDKITKQQENI